MKRIYSFVSFADIPANSIEHLEERRIFELECNKRNIPIFKTPCDVDGDGLYITEENSGWNVNGKRVLHLSELFDDALLVHRLCTNIINEADYAEKMALWQDKVTPVLRTKTNELDYMFRGSFHSLFSVHDTYEWLTGGVTFYDYEWFLIDNDPIKKVFQEVDSEGSTRYVLNLDDKILLRGPDIYYFFSCYISRYEKPTYAQACMWIDNCVNFLSNVLRALENYHVEGDTARRMLLAIIDNLRNIILLMANSEALIRMNAKSSCLLVDSDMPWNSKIDLYQTIIWDIVNCNNLQGLPTTVSELCNWMKIELQAMKQELKSVDDSFVFSKCFNPLREVDNYFENYIVLKETANRFDESDTLNLIGVLYGGLELPYILRRIRNREDNVFLVFQNNGMYLDRQAKDPGYSYGNLIIDKDVELLKDGINILIDENVMSGKTLQLIINDLADSFITINKCVVIRHPCINRIEQLLHNKTAVDLTQLGNYILGALSPTPYTKVRKGTNYANMFTDELYIFSLMTEVFLKGLYKNNSFIKDSEVDIFSGFSPGRDTYKL